jgi:hypothetical protein
VWSKLFAALHSVGTLVVFGLGVVVYDHGLSRILLGLQAVRRRQTRYEGVQLGPRTWVARELDDDAPA